MEFPRPRSGVFGEVALVYDRIRPRYPDQLIDDVLSFGAAHRAEGIRTAVEVGAGTGQATSAFAERGVAVTAVEPDGRMAEVLASREYAVTPTVVVASFEATSFAGFDALYSATAWHWTEPASRWERAARAVVPGGTVALFWNNGGNPADPQVLAALEEIHRHHAPELVDGVGGGSAWSNTWPREEMQARPEFVDYTEQTYGWERTLSVADYVAYLSTVSAYRVLPGPTRDGLFDEIRAGLDGDVVVTMRTALYLAARTSVSG